MFGRDFHFYSNISGIRESGIWLLPLTSVPKEPHLFQTAASLVCLFTFCPLTLVILGFKGQRLYKTMLSHHYCNHKINLHTFFSFQDLLKTT